MYPSVLFNANLFKTNSSNLSASRPLQGTSVETRNDSQVPYKLVSGPSQTTNPLSRPQHSNHLHSNLSPSPSIGSTVSPAHEQPRATARQFVQPSRPTELPPQQMPEINIAPIVRDPPRPTTLSESRIPQTLPPRPALPSAPKPVTSLVIC